jgi:hypothetical protein
MPLPSPASHARGRSTGGRRRTWWRAAVGAAAAGLCLVGLPALANGGLASAATAPSPAKKIGAYWLVAADGGIFAFGGAGFHGSTGNIRLNKPVVGMAGTADGGGYWLVASDGGIFAFGDAGFHGSTGSLQLNKPVVGMAATPNGGGYWLVASDGGIFAFGDAGFYGSMGGRPLNQPVVGMAATPDGGGYWLVAADGGIFAFGDAGFYGSTGNITLNKPIVGMTADPAGHGYWFTASDGGVFAYGSAPFYGSLGSVPQSHPIVAMASSPDGKGYWFTNSNGAVTGYGDATYWGSAPQVINQPVVGMAEATGSGNFTGSSYPSGSFGYDISNYQCGNLPPAPHTIGLVEVVGSSMGATNSCLGAEAAWAGGGLNLYIYLTYGTDGGTGDPACNTTAVPAACEFGYDTALDGFGKARAQGVDTSVAWWLDVESDPSWSSDLAANAALVQGAVDGLHSRGLNSVGIYASPGSWNGIVGDYQPGVPYWAASWGVDPATTCSSVRSQFPDAALPTGPVQLVQYSSPSFAYPAGGMDTAFDDDYAC